MTSSELLSQSGCQISIHKPFPHTRSTLFLPDTNTSSSTPSYPILASSLRVSSSQSSNSSLASTTSSTSTSMPTTTSIPTRSIFSRYSTPNPFLRRHQQDDNGEEQPDHVDTVDNNEEPTGTMNERSFYHICSRILSSPVSTQKYLLIGEDG